MGQDPQPRFTVIIPTKGRADYLYHTLRTCSLQEYDNLEVIVSDDGSTDHTRDVVETAARKDPRIRYITPSEGIGMRNNFEFALSQVKPGYVIALGGDDGLLPYGVTGMRDHLLETGQELLAWPTPVYFYSGTKMPTSQLVLPIRFKKRIIKSEEFLARQAKVLGYVGDIESPMFYVKGVTSTRLVDQVRSRSADGQFYSCSTPDGYSGIVLAGEVQTYAFSEVPFSLHSLSPTSTGLGYLAKSEEAKQRSAAFFREAESRPMHKELASQPYSPLISLMTADYLLTARDLPGWPGSFPPIDYRELLLKALNELADGLYSYDRINRELAILMGIAEHHGLGSFFRKMVRSKRRNTRKPLEGNAVSPRAVFLDGHQFGIHNLFDAAFVSRYFYQFGRGLSLSVIMKTMGNSASYRMKSFGKAEKFPPEAEWCSG